MQRNVIRSIRVVFLLFIAFALLGGGIAEAVKGLNKRLKGDYEYTLSIDCVQNTAGFDEDDHSLLGPGDARTLNVRGTITYDGAGEGTIAATGITHFHDFLQRTGNFPLSKWDAQCTLTYTVFPDGSFTQEVLLCSWETDTGGTGTTTGIMWQGQIADEGMTLLIADPDPNVETIDVTGGPTYMRICGRSGMAVKLK